MRALRSSQVVLADGVRPATVLIEGERIVEVATFDAPLAPDTALEDLSPWWLAPGLCDTHVHINEPGRTTWEGFETATRAAAAGGVTTVVDMPLNSIPVTTTADALAQKLEATRGRLWVDVGFWGGVVPHHQRALEGLARRGILGAKAFMCPSGIDEFPACGAEDLRAAMPILRDAGLPLLVHAEIEDGGTRGGSPQTYATYLGSRPASYEEHAIALVIDLCRETGCAVHIVHLSAATALPMLRRAREEGLPVTAETCPHYLCLCAEEVPSGATEFKCAPPIRGRANRDALWEGLRAGVIDFVVSDHSPCTPGLKVPERGDFLAAWGGIASLQLGLGAIWTEARARGFAPEALSRWMSAEPARLFGLPGKGRIAVGADADLVAWDPDARYAVEPTRLYHRHAITPYKGRELCGRVEKTWLRGAVVFERAHGPQGPHGRPLLRNVAREVS